MIPPVNYAALVDPPFRHPDLKPDAQAIQAFAVTNGGEYFVGAGAQPLPGIIFREADGTSRKLQRAGDIVRFPGPPQIEVGNSAYSVAVNLNLMSIPWGYAAVPLAVPLPVVILESTRNQARSPLPALPRGTAPLPLGGGAFTAFAAPEATAWVSTVFTDDLCRVLDDGETAFDLEIVAGWLFLYAPGELSTTDPSRWQRIFDTVAALLSALTPTSVSPRPSAAPAPPAAMPAAAPQAALPQADAAAPRPAETPPTASTLPCASAGGP